MCLRGGPVCRKTSFGSPALESLEFIKAKTLNNEFLNIRLKPLPQVTESIDLFYNIYSKYKTVDGYMVIIYSCYIVLFLMT